MTLMNHQTHYENGTFPITELYEQLNRAGLEGLAINLEKLIKDSNINLLFSVNVSEQDKTIKLAITASEQQVSDRKSNVVYQETYKTVTDDPNDVYKDDLAKFATKLKGIFSQLLK